MIEVIVNKNKDFVKNITISGHANSAKHGEDLVCAGVSAVSVGVLNSLDTFGLIDQMIGNITMDEGYISIVVDSYNEKINVILETLIISLKTIEQGNKEYIKITEV